MVFKFNLPTFLTILILVVTSNAEILNIRGYLKSAETGAAIKDAVITIKNRSFVVNSDTNGLFEIVDSTRVRSYTNTVLSASASLRYNSHSRILRWNNKINPRSVSLFSLNGRKIFNSEIDEGVSSLVLPSFASGLAILSVEGQAHKFVEKIFTKRDFYYQYGISGGVGKEPRDNDSLTMVITHPGYITRELKVASNSNSINVFMATSPTADIFDDSKVHTYSVNISEQMMDSLHKTVKDEIYMPCTLSFNGEPVGIVGLRYQGSDYHLNLYFDENGEKTVPKVSFKIKFDEYELNKRFFGLKRLILNAMDTDATCIRNMLSYTLFNEMGIHSCRTAFARLEINGKYEGLFLALEPIDGEYLDKRFNGYGNGNLYKEVWPGNTHFQGALDNLKTKDYIGNVSGMMDFDSAITDMTVDNFKNEINKWTDLDYMLRFLAVDRAVVAIDGIMTWYVMGKFYGNHNYYWYEENKMDGKFYLLPWDYDATFYAPDVLFDVAGMPRWNEEPVTDTFTIFGDGKVVCPSSDKFIYMLGQTSWDRYVEVATEFLNNQFSVQNLSDKLTKWRDLIDPHLKDDPNLWITYNGWKEAIESFVGSVEFYRTRFSKILEGPDDFIIPDPDLTPSDSYNGLMVGKDNNFEFTADISPLSNVGTYASAGSESFIELNDSNALSGNSDIKLTTHFEPTPGAWSEWSGFAFDLHQGAHDISDIKRLLITARAEKNVNVRLNLESGAYPDPYGVKYGISLGLTTELKVFVIDPDILFYPDWGSQANVKDEVLTSCSGLEFTPDAAFTSTGELLAPDTVIFYIDDIRFLK